MGMTGIERIEQNGKGRYLVLFSDGRRLPLYTSDLHRFRLEEGAELTPERADEIYHTCVRVRARKKILALLERSDQPEKELRRKLAAAGYEEETVADAVEYARLYGYIDDARYAREYVRVKSGTKSRRQIEAELKQKGIRPEEIPDLFPESDGEVTGEVQAIRQFLRKKLPIEGEATMQEKQKLAAALYRKGFPSDIIRRELQM